VIVAILGVLMPLTVRGVMLCGNGSTCEPPPKLPTLRYPAPGTRFVEGFRVGSYHIEEGGFCSMNQDVTFTQHSGFFPPVPAPFEDPGIPEF